jgi:plastocyanin
MKRKSTCVGSCFALRPLSGRAGECERLKPILRGTARPALLFPVLAILMAGAATGMLQAKEWQAIVGAESPNRGNQVLAFLPNEFWVYTGDSIRWTFSAHERHTLTFLTSAQTRPAGFGPTYGIEVGCPGATADGASFDGSTCVNSDTLLMDEDSASTATAPTYSVTFPVSGNFKFVCLIHAEMTGIVHVVNSSQVLPHDQNFYDQQAESQLTLLLTEASRLKDLGTLGAKSGLPGNVVAAGMGQNMTLTGAGSQAVSLMRFSPETIDVEVGDTVEFSSLEPSINHTVTFGTEPADPRPASTNVLPTSDGARKATIVSTGDNVNSGFLTPAPQDRAGLAESLPGVTRFRVTFTSAGTFNYICANGDELGMKGTVIVHP